jgi:hypothetical protein
LLRGLWADRVSPPLTGAPFTVERLKADRGELVVLSDPFATEMVLRGGDIVEVRRHTGHLVTSSSTVGWFDTPDGRHLPSLVNFSVTDTRSGRLAYFERLATEFGIIDGIPVPTGGTITAWAPDESSHAHVELGDLQLEFAPAS